MWDKAVLGLLFVKIGVAVSSAAHRILFYLTFLGWEISGVEVVPDLTFNWYRVFVVLSVPLSPTNVMDCL